MSRVTLGDVATERKENYKGDKSNLPIVGLEHLVPGEIILSNWDENVDNTFTKAFHAGNVLFGRRRAYLKKAAVAPFDGICSGDITVIEAKKNQISPALLPFIIQNDALFDYAVEKSAGSLSPRVKWEHLKTFEFELPNMEKQQELATALWSIIKTKEAYQKLITATDDLAKSQFIEQFDNGKYECIALNEVCSTFVDGDWIETKDQSNEGIRLIQTGNIGNGIYIDKEDHARYISENTFQKLGCTEVLQSDILISRLPDPIGRACIIPGGLGKMITAVDCTILRLCNEVLPEFFVAYTLTPHYQSQINSLTTGSTRKRISRNNLGQIKLPVPPIENQKQFVELVHQSDKSKFELEQALNELTETYKCILKEIFE